MYIVPATPLASPNETHVHKRFMRAALEMADTALRTDEVPVGCVFVHRNKIIGRGMNDTNRSLCGTRHAEFIAIEAILREHPPSIFRETDLYVTVEPCVMCASALRQLRIRRVFFGCLNDRFGGCGGVLRIHEDPTVVEAGYKVYGGINHDEAIILLRRFYIQENERAPQPLAKKQRTLKTEVLPFGASLAKEPGSKNRKKVPLKSVLGKKSADATAGISNNKKVLGSDGKGAEVAAPAFTSDRKKGLVDNVSEGGGAEVAATTTGDAK